jgi:NtrC-family two-component system sensor histidine kinase KinB
MMKSLSYKIGLGYFVLICINVAIAVFAIYHIVTLGSPVERVLQEKYQNVSAAQSMIQALNQQKLTQQAMLENRLDSTLLSDFHTYKNEFLNWHQKAIEGIALPSEPVLLDSIMKNFQDYLALSDSLHRMFFRQIPSATIREFYRYTVIHSADRVEQFCQQLKEVNQFAISEADQRAKTFSRRATVFIILFSMLAIALSVLASIRFTRGILKPVRLTTETVKKIGQGQLNQKVTITTDDEIADLGREFNKMTERLEAYERLNIQQILLEKRKSEAIVAGIPVSIMVTDQDKRIVLMNEQAMKLLDLLNDSWRGAAVNSIVKDETLAKLLSGETRTEKAESDPTRSLITIEKDKHQEFYVSRQIDILDENGNIMGLVTILQDVTGFKNLDRLKSEFMATISHEFRTPLTSINMAMDILLKEVKGPLNEYQRELLNDARQDGQRLKSLVKDLLDLSKLEAEKFPFDFRPVVLDDLLKYALHPLRLLLEEKQIQLQLKIDPAIPEFMADFHQLSRVVTNLVENAIQHTPPAGKIEITARQLDQQLKLEVIDQGEGIPPEAIDLIFDKFVQVKNFNEVDSGNVGLGLAISREIVRAHQGQIGVESKVGHGSRFYFSIPFTRST